MIPASEVSACLVTRGDVDMEPVLASLRPVFDEIRVYDNSQREDRAVFGRYIAVEEASHLIVFVQDDDVILPEASIRALLNAYEPGLIVANMPERFRPHYPDSCLVGFGAVFDQELPDRAFWRFLEKDGLRETGGPTWCSRCDEEHGSDMFRRTCDVVFTTLTPFTLVDLEYQDREFASAPTRMWKQPGHHAERQRVLAVSRQARDGR